MFEIQHFIMHACILFKDSASNQSSISYVHSLSKVGQQALTLGLLRGLEERPVDAPLTERDLTERQEVKRHKYI